MQQQEANNYRTTAANKKKIQIFFLSILLTLLCYSIVYRWLVPGVNFFIYLIMEIMIALSIKFVAYLTKSK